MKKFDKLLLSDDQLRENASGDQATRPVIRNDQQVSPSGLSIQQIYKNAGLAKEGDEGFSLFKVETMLDDTSIIELDQSAKEAAVIMALKSHDVPLESVIDDGREHQMALDEHDRRFQEELRTLNLKLEEENLRLHSEIERYANPRLERMEANQSRVDALQMEYQRWCENKNRESQRINRMLKRWTGESDVGGGSAVSIDLAATSSYAPMSNSLPPMSNSLPPMSNSLPPMPHSPQLVASKTVAPLQLFDDYEDGDFVVPVTLTRQDFSGGNVAKGYPQTGVPSANQDSIPHLSPPGSLGSGFDTMASEDDFPLEASKKSSVLGNLGYYSWALLSLVFLFLGAITLASVAETVVPIVALGLAFGIPLCVSLLMALLSRGHGRWLGYIAFLGYCGLGMCVIAHLDPDNLAKIMSQDPLRLAEVSDLDGTMIALPDFLRTALTQFSTMYSDLLYSIGLASKP